MSSSDDDGLVLPGAGRPNNNGAGGRGRGGGGRVLRNFVAESNLSSSDSDDDVLLPGTGPASSKASPAPEKTVPKKMGLPSTSAQKSAPKTAPKKSGGIPSPAPASPKKKTTNQLVTESWKAVCSKFTFAQVGKLFYDDLFEKAPALKASLFDKTDMAMQPAILIKTIDAAVKLLDQPAQLGKVLVQLGERHAAYGSEEAHYTAVGQVFLGVLAQALLNQFTPEVQQAWTEVYGVIQTKMLEGQNSPKGREIAADSAAKKKAAGGAGGSPLTVIGWAVALSDYASGADQQLRLQNGDRLAIMEKDPSGWWVGQQQRTGNIGLFPSTYVEEVPEEKPTKPNAKAPVVSPPPDDAPSTTDDSSDDSSLKFEEQPDSPVTPVKPIAKKSADPLASTVEGRDFTPTAATPSQSQARLAGSAARHTAGALTEDTSDVSLNLDSSATNMTPMQDGKRGGQGGQSPATLHKAAQSADVTRREESLGEVEHPEKKRTFKNTVGKTEIDSSPRDSVSDIKRKYASVEEEPKELLPAKKKKADLPPAVEQPTQVAPVVSLAEQAQKEQEAEDRDRDPALDDILPPSRAQPVAAPIQAPPADTAPVARQEVREEPPVPQVAPPVVEQPPVHAQGPPPPGPATPNRTDPVRPLYTSPSPTDPHSGAIRTASPNRPPTGPTTALAPPPGVTDRNRRDLLQRAQERLQRRDSGTGHLQTSDRAPSPSMDLSRGSGGGAVLSAADQTARDRLAKENNRLTEELSFLQKDNQRLRQGLAETHSSESHRLKAQLEESEAVRKEHELTIARQKLQFDVQHKDAAEHERNLKEELRAYSTTLEQFESVCSDKDQQLTIERALSSKLKQDLKEKEAECIRSADDATRIREDSKVRLERTTELLEDAKKQRTHLIELNDKFGRDKESAVAERKRISEELKGVQLEIARQAERAEDDAAASRRECDRYKALVQEKDRVLGMRIADEQRSKEHYQSKLAEVEDQLVQIKTHNQEVLRTIQEEHRRQVNQVRDETASYQIKCREAQAEAEAGQKRFEEKLDIERKQIIDEMNGLYASMEKDLNDARAHVNRDESYINQLKSEVAELAKNFEELEAAQGAKDEKLEAQEVELRTVTETLETLLNSDDHVGKERDDLVSELDKAQVDMANMRDDVAMVRTLDDQLQELSRECERLSEELGRVSKDRSSLWTENHRLESELAQWRSEAQELRANLKGRGISARVSGGGNHDFTY